MTPIISVLSRRFARLPLYVWLLWAAAALLLAACPMLLSDPALWVYLLDPEVLALIVIIGVQYTRWEAGLLCRRVRDRLRRTAHRTARAWHP